MKARTNPRHQGRKSGQPQMAPTTEAAADSQLQDALEKQAAAQVFFDEFKPKYDAARKIIFQEEAEARANPAPKTERQKRAEIRDQLKRIRALNDEWCAAESKLHEATALIAAIRAGQIAVTCKRGDALTTCQVGDLVVLTAIQNYYGKDCLTVLRDHTKCGCGDEDIDGYIEMYLAQGCGYSGPVLLTVVKPLPTKAEYENLRRECYTRPLPELIREAYQLIGDHLSDLRDKQDNASEAAQESDAYANRDEQITELESVDTPIVHESAAAIMVFHEPKYRGLREAARILDACIKVLKSKAEQADLPDELKVLADELDETLGVLEAL